MNDQISLLSLQILAEINTARRILLSCHPSPDGDSVGSVLAMRHALVGINKKVTAIMGDSEPPSSLSGLPGFSQIELKNIFQIDLSQFDLFIILDSSSLGQISKLGEIKFPPGMRTIVIDHHSTNTELADINLVQTTYPAVAQILYDLFKIWKFKITPDIAACLFAGIYTDTGFKYPLTTAHTFAAASDLATVYPDFPKIVFQIENSFSPEHFEYLKLALNSVELYFSGRVAISATPFLELQKRGIRNNHTENMEISNILKSVVGREIGIAFVEIQPDVISLSFRSRNEVKYNVARIATATKFGGGHPAAAAATLRMPYAEAKKYLLATIQQVYPDLGQP